MIVNIRLENEEDYPKVEEMAREAFWNLYVPGCEEHYLCHILREHEDFIQELDYVAEVDGNIAGSIMYSKSCLLSDDFEQVPIVSFGPLCVHPEYQRKGIGTALIERTKSLVEKTDIPAIVIYGDPHNYCKHGFKNGMDYKVSNMDGEFPLGLLVLELKPGFFGTRKWKARQSDVFKYSQIDAAEYDKKFQKNEKKFQYSQEIFKIQIRSFLRDTQLTTEST
ncbi:GNAT family N-acetyltransferase [Desulfatitalea alkaliphila]|uniref:N-acetyltransferase n=1 Tax=Desulfatitalea alkaliphila TaxID=2929485 RepID=A0AA41R178_9BACT|nr:N-acetyltransferase [Desulfatitalea alkaliphila]MCJ8500287.1 N-acetyltransferase [Desulfatitalea alkaliphila]